MTIRMLYVLAALLLVFCSKPDPHAGHDHASHAEESHDDHAGHDHGKEAGGDDHAGHDHGAVPEGGTGVTLDAGAQRIAGIKTAKLARRVLETTVELPGRIGFNEERLVHITPRYGGLIKEVHAAVGKYVREGDVLAMVENSETMASYEIKAPINGRIITRYAVPGAVAADDRELFELADLGEVWVNCEVYVKDIDLLKTGMNGRVRAVGADQSAPARISYIAPVFNESGATGLVRLSLVNKDGIWRPGMFVRVSFTVKDKKAVLAVPDEAVQTVDNEPVVFVPGPANSFFSCPVTVGRRMGGYTQIRYGLAPGAEYIAEGAFELKATLVTSGMDPHAGHGH